jgi:glycosyltransferase involved in cell wall biosynthesis
MHKRLAESLGCDVDFIDLKARWQDQGNSKIFNLISWFRNAKHLQKKYPDHEVLLIDNLHFTPVILNLFFSQKRRKIIVHLGSHTLYFIYAKVFSRMNRWLHKEMLKRYDVLVCEGAMALQMATAILKDETPPAYVTFLGPSAERYSVLNEIKPKLNSDNLIIIANGPTKFRSYYKGLDIMLRAFEKALEIQSGLRLKILGSWNQEVIEESMAIIRKATAKQITFVGNVQSVVHHLHDASLCLHCTRGDAFPTSTLEAMAAGVPTLVSDWTGTKEVIEKVDPKLIVPLDELKIAYQIIWYLKLPMPQKEDLSLRCKRATEKYTQELAIDHYRRTFDKIFEDLGFHT